MDELEQKHNPAIFNFIVGLILSLVAGVVIYDSSQVSSGVVGFVGPAVSPMIFGIVLLILGFLHLYQAFVARQLEKTGTSFNRPKINLKASSLILLAFVGLIVLLLFGSGFIIAATFLYSVCYYGLNTKFNYKSLFVGALIAGLFYVLFVVLLKLTLPAGPLEKFLISQI